MAVDNCLFLKTVVKDATRVMTASKQQVMPQFCEECWEVEMPGQTRLTLNTLVESQRDMSTRYMVL